MDNIGRCKALIVNGFISSAIGILLLLIAVVFDSIPSFNISVILFGLMVTNLIMAGLFVDNDKEQPIYVLLICYILLLPLTIVIVIGMSITEGFENFIKNLKGGDHYYDE